MTEQDEEPPTTHEDQIFAFIDEIRAAIPCETIEGRENEGSMDSLMSDVKIVALYLARFWHSQNPWWADEALQKLFSGDLPVTKAVVNTHHAAMERRRHTTAREQGQMLRRYEEKKLKDLAFYQIEDMRQTGVPLAKACEGIAIWLEDFSKGNAQVRLELGFTHKPKRMWKAATLEREAPSWRDDWLQGRLWAESIRNTVGKMDEATRKTHGEKVLARLQSLGPARGHFLGKRR